MTSRSSWSARVLSWFMTCLVRISPRFSMSASAWSAGNPENCRMFFLMLMF